MPEKCFYCESNMDGQETIHQVSFYANNEEREETLCPDCYQEWLQGIKG
jgi:hypothetical protein